MLLLQTLRKKLNEFSMEVQNHNQFRSIFQGKRQKLENIVFKVQSIPILAIHSLKTGSIILNKTMPVQP